MQEPNLEQIHRAAKEVSKFLNIDINESYKNIEYEWYNPGKTVANEWINKNPRTQKEREVFYKSTKTYIYDLIVESLRKERISWRDSIFLYLSNYESKNTLLDYGGGVGTDTIYFQNAGYESTYYDLAGVTSDFASYRFGLYSPEINHVNIKHNLKTYDIITCLEVLEHLEDPLNTMQFLYDSLNEEGLLFLTQSFSLISDAYPSHLPENEKLLKTWEEDLVKIGFSIIDCLENRILVLGKYKPVDIVMPIYNAKKYVEECIESVKLYTKNVPYRFIFINDASTEQGIKKVCITNLEENDVFISNEHNLGFVKSANIGLSNSNNDIVILNTDTVVTEKWLSSLQKHIYRKKRFATANPITNNASIYSIDSLSNLCEKMSVNELGKIVNKSSLDLIPEIPVGVGFCLFIKRQALDLVGLFDEAFERGYGEESDFCMRCREEGFTHILVDSSFVYHKGHVSMLLSGDIQAKDVSILSHENILQSRYPNYNDLIMSFQESGIMERIKENILESIASYLSKKRYKILYALHKTVSGESIGGTEFHVKDLIDHLDSTYALYVIYIQNGQHVIVEEYIDGINNKYLFELPFILTEYSLNNSYLFRIYSEIIKTFNIDILHIQHLISHTLEIINAAKKLNVPIYMTVHDYYLISPDYNLLYRTTPQGYSEYIKPSKKYMEQNFGLIDFDHNKWQKQMLRGLASIDTIIFPSEIAKNEIRKVYPTILEKSIVIPHGSEIPNNIIIEKSNNKIFKVLFLGYVNGKQKGNEIIENILNNLLNHKIEVHLLGTNEQYWQKYTDNKYFFCDGNYERKNIINILNKLNPDLIVIASPWPETFSYTYSEALLAKIPILAYDIGAFSERALMNKGTILVKDVTASALSEKIIQLSKKNKEYILAKEGIKTAKVKDIKDNVEEYNDLYQKTLKQTTKIFIIKNEWSESIKQTSLALFSMYNSLWKKEIQKQELLNNANYQIKQITEEIEKNKEYYNNLVSETNQLKQFHLHVTSSLYYRIYLKIRRRMFYKILKKIKYYINK